MLIQIVCLRMLLDLNAGDERAIGIALAAWFMLIAFGNAAGRLFFKTESDSRKTNLAFTLTPIAAAVSFFLIRNAGRIFGAAPGWTPYLWQSALISVFALAPACIALGLQFPSGSQKEEAGRLYAFEAAGAAIAGGLFTFVLCGRVGAQWVLLSACVISAVTALFTGGWKTKILAIISASTAAAIILMAPLYPGLSGLVSKKDSAFGETALYRGQDGRQNIYQSGRLIFTYPDQRAEELRAHISLLVSQSPTRVLFIGGSPGAVREALKYQVLRADLVQTGNFMAGLSAGMLTAEDKLAISPARAGFSGEDGRRLVKLLTSGGRQGGYYDLMVVNMPPPSTMALNRFYTEDFFASVKKALPPRGIIALWLPPAKDENQMLANASVYKALKTVFGNTALTAGEYGGMFASASPINTDTGLLVSRYAASGVKTAFLNSTVLADAFSPPQVSALEHAYLKIGAPANSDQRPSGIPEWIFMPGLSGIAVLGILALAGIYTGGIRLRSTSPNAADYLSAASTGYFGVTVALSAMLGIQSVAGDLSGQIGALAGLFMAGLFAGSISGRKLWRLAHFEFASILFLLLSAFVIRGYSYYVFTFFGGYLTGALFGTVAEKQQGRGAHLYSLELSGAAIGAAVVSVLLVPAAGIPGALIAAAAVKAVSVAIGLKGQSAGSILNS